MNCAQINRISFEHILKKFGYLPVKITSKERWYKSPFRNEKTASFKTCNYKNTFFDFGEGLGGTVIDFWCKYRSCDIKTAINEISNTFSFHEQNEFKNVKTEKRRSPIEIIETKSITHPALMKYLFERGLSKKVYDYIHEVHFLLKGNLNYAIGFKNDKGDFELRNKLFKGCTGKAITSIIKEESSTLCVFEGFIDFLSYLEQSEISNIPSVQRWYKDEKESYLILNSLALKQQAIPFFTQFEKVKLYLDNDSAE